MNRWRIRTAVGLVLVMAVVTSFVDRAVALRYGLIDRRVWMGRLVCSCSPALRSSRAF